MEENIDFVELQKSLSKFKELTEKMSHNLASINNLIKENINSGAGVWDSELAASYRMRWEALMEEFPTILYTFNQQASNLEIFINNMKKVEER